MRKVHWAPLKYFVIVFAFETIHTVGVAILFYAVLPQLDSLRAMLLTNGVLIFPACLAPFRPSIKPSSSRKYVMLGLDILALLFQICGLIVWPVLNSHWRVWKMDQSWALPIGLLMTSFGWWESFVDETFGHKIIKSFL